MAMQATLLLICIFCSLCNEDWSCALGASYCLFTGIRCELDSIVQINLSDKNLTGTLPESIYKLGRLARLLLPGNGIYGNLPRTLGNLSRLVYISMRNNRLGFFPKEPPPLIKNTIPRSIESLKELTYLDLGNNRLSGIIPEQIGGLKKIQVLLLNDNRLTGEIPAQFGRLTTLTYLALADMGLYSTIPKTFKSLTNLKSLGLSNSKLYGTIPTEMALMKSLEFMNLQSNQLKGPIPTEFEQMDTLQTLALSGNTLSGTLPTALAGMESLVNLYLSKNSFTGPLPNITSGYRSLENLVLTSNPLNTRLPEFGLITRLFTLNMAFCGLTGAIPSSLAELKNLNVLGLNGNSLTGTIPKTFGKMSSMTQLFLFSNSLSGTIPQSFNNLTRMMQFFVYDNAMVTPSTWNPTFQGVLFVYDPQRFRCFTNETCAPISGQYCSGEGQCQCLPGFELITKALGGYCQDIDECQTDLYRTTKSANTKASCVSRRDCINAPGTFYCCNSGYENTDPTRQGTEQDCTDINECYTGEYLLLPSENTRAPCNPPISETPPLYSCVNTNGSFLCCAKGWANSNILKTNATCADVNECETRQYALLPSNNTKKPCSSFENCVNTPGSFECCLNGFENPNKGDKCEDINECATGSFASLPSANTGRPCTGVTNCLNGYGHFNCCTVGYYNPSTKGEACIDINECEERTHSCSSANGTYCHNTEGWFECLTCQDEELYERVINENQTRAFRSLLEYTKEVKKYPLDFLTCFGLCESGVRVLRFSQESASCSGSIIDPKSILCSYPCSNQTATTATDSILTLKKELSRGGFFKNLISVLFQLDVTIRDSKTTKRDTSTSTFDIEFSSCPSKNYSQLLNLTNGLIREITPNAPSLELVSSNCDPSRKLTFQVTTQDPKSEGIYSPIFATLACVIILLLLLALFFFWRRRKSNLHLLPSEVAWSFQLYESSYDWSYRGTDRTGFHYKTVDSHSHEWKKAMELFDSLGTHVYKIDSISLIYNKLLITSFIGTYLIQLERVQQNPNLFRSQKWRKEETPEAIAKHDWVHSHYEKIADLFSFNQQVEVKIIPLLHGTDLAVAEKICETGFAALSALDAGFYGKGIYFTSFPTYCIPYIASRRSPAIIVSYVIPGNVYPCIEDHQGKSSLIGAAIKNGYNSHFVVTNPKGHCLTSEAPTQYNEIVIPQEAQIVPAFLFELNAASLYPLAQQWIKTNEK